MSGSANNFMSGFEKSKGKKQKMKNNSRKVNQMFVIKNYNFFSQI